MKALRKLLSLVTLAAVAAGAVVAFRRHSRRHRERLDLYYEDGSMVSLEEGSEAAERLLPLARDALRTARSN